MKRLLILIIVPIILFILAASWWYLEAQPVSENTSQEDFLIVKGSSAGAIGESLAKAGLIKSSIAFKLYVQVTGKQKRIQAGVYRLSGSYSLFRIVNELLKGPIEVWVTVPEGLRREEIVERFINSFNLKDSNSFRSEFLSVSKGKEGFLFPDTYLFPKTATASAVVAKMISVFDRRVDAKIKSDIAASNLSLSQTITLASIIERETKTDGERPVVSGILIKRLKAGWPLQADATLQYAVATTRCQFNTSCSWWTPLVKDDLSIKSAYNTYKYPGLPPAPIASPGLSSIKAVVYPEDSDYWFYLHDSQEQIHYAKTIDEHNQNVKMYLGK